jgi:hypothetical protein
MIPEKIDHQLFPATLPKAAAALPENALTAKKADAGEARLFWEYCDNCGAQLQSFRCRLVCPKCGFFHSCSEP